MNKRNLIVGLTYLVTLHGDVVPASLLRIDQVSTGKRTLTRYRCKNLDTGREITVKSPTRFLRRERGLLNDNDKTKP